MTFRSFSLERLRVRSTPAQSDGSQPWRTRLPAVVASLPFLALLAQTWAQAIGTPYLASIVGLDYHTYIDATGRFLAGGTFYPSWQLAGSYGVAAQPVLYPPETLVLFIPFTVLPAILWWVLPLAVTAAVVVHWRPVPLAWPVLAACLWWPDTSVKLVAGNPVIWVTMFLALGTVWRWPAVLVALKLTLAPFALIGVRDPRWWLAGAIGALPFIWLVPQYITALANFSGGGVLYSVQEVPILLIPLVAYVARRRPVRPGVSLTTI